MTAPSGAAESAILARSRGEEPAPASIAGDLAAERR